MKTVAIIQARMDSTRLPGKVMKLLCGQTILGHVITRVAACPLVEEVVVATSTFSQNDIIAEESRRSGAKVFRGSEEDVLGRYYGAAQEAGAEIIIRVTSDCPLFDPNVLTAMLNQFHALRTAGYMVDYLSNVLERTYPRGLDAEIFTFAALAWGHREAKQAYEREHVTPFLHQHPELFSLYSFRGPGDWSGYRWTLDTQEDWRLIEAIYAALGHEKEIFTTQAVLALLAARPEIVAINAHVEQKKLDAPGAGC